MSFSSFNAVLLDISNQLSSDQLEEIKFLCPDLGRRHLEEMDSGIKLFRVLMERGKLAEDNTEGLRQLLVRIKQPHLAETLERFRPQSGFDDSQLDPAERAKLGIATEVISQSLGRSWRKFGRKLGVADVKLESISNKFPMDLEETAVELLKEWRRNRGAQAKTEELVRALRDCKLNLTADNLEDRLTNPIS